MILHPYSQIVPNMEMIELEKDVAQARYNLALRKPRFQRAFAEFLLQKIRERLPRYKMRVLQAIENGRSKIELKIWEVPSGWRWWTGMADWPQCCRDEPKAMNWILSGYQYFVTEYAKSINQIIGYRWIVFLDKYSYSGWPNRKRRLQGFWMKIDLKPNKVKTSHLMEPFDIIVPELREKYQLSSPNRQLIAEMLLEMIRTFYTCND